MDKQYAKLVVDALKRNNGPTLSIYEAMQMTKVNTDGLGIYVLQKGDVTFLAWIVTGRMTMVRVKTVSW